MPGTVEANLVMENLLKDNDAFTIELAPGGIKLPVVMFLVP